MATTTSPSATSPAESGQVPTPIPSPQQLEYMAMFQQHNEILYNNATKEGLDPNIISKLHQFISIFDTTPHSRHKIEVLSVLTSNIQAFIPLFEQTLPQTSQIQCTYPIRSKIYKSNPNPSNYKPVKEDFATLSWTILRYIRHLTIDKDTTVRTQALRTIRYWCISDLIIEAFLSLGVDYLVARAIEREHRYLDERLQGLKLVRHIMQFNDQYITRPIIVTLLALSEQPKEEFRIVALDTLKDLLLTQPTLILGTTNARQILTDAILDPSLAELSSPLTWSILYLYDTPSTRHLFTPAYDFGRIFACYTDLTNTIVNTIEQPPNSPPLNPNSPLLIKEKEAHRESAHRVLLTFMRSLAGLFALSSHPVLLQSFVHMLSLPSRIPSVSWAKESVFEVFYDTLRIVTSYDLVTHKRALLNYTKQRNFLAQRQRQQLTVLAQANDVFNASNFSSELFDPIMSYSHGSVPPSLGGGSPLPSSASSTSSSSILDSFSQPAAMTNFFNLRSQLIQTQTNSVSIRHVSLLHTYMVLVLTICIRSGLLEHLSMLTLCQNDDLAQPALKLLTEIIRLSCGLFPAQIATQLQTFPSLLQNAIVLNPNQNQSQTSVHNLWQSSIPVPIDTSLPALINNLHSPHSTPQYISSLTTSPLKSISDSNTSWAIDHLEKSSQASIRMQSLQVLSSLFQANIKYLSIATSQDTFLSEHERQTTAININNPSSNQGVGQIGDGTDGITKTNFIDHGIDLSRVVIDTDQSSSRHSFLPTLPAPVTMISPHFAAEEAIYYEYANVTNPLVSSSGSAPQPPGSSPSLAITPTPGIVPFAPLNGMQTGAVVSTGLDGTTTAAAGPGVGIYSANVNTTFATATGLTGAKNNNTATIQTKLGPLTVLKGTRRPHPKSRELHSLFLQSQTQQQEAQVLILLKQTNVLATKDQTQWDFNLVLQILETLVLSRSHFLAALRTKFFKRLLSFLRPDKHFFTEMFLTLPHATLHAKVAAQLIRVMVMYPEGRDYQFFTELMDLVIDCLSEEAQRAESLVSAATLKLHPAHNAMQIHVQHNTNSGPLLTRDGSSLPDDEHVSALVQQSAAVRAQFDTSMMLELGLVDGEIGSPMYQLNQGFYNYSENNKEGLYLGPGGTLISAGAENGPEHSKIDQSTVSSVKSPKKGISSFFANLGKGDKRKDEGNSRSQVEDSHLNSRYTATKRVGASNFDLPEHSMIRASLLKSPFDDDSRFHQGVPVPVGGYVNPHNSSQPGTGGSAATLNQGAVDDFAGPRFRPFSHHNAIHRLCREYVTIFGILSSTPYGLTILLRYGFFDLIAPFGACAEYDYLSRLLLFSLDFTNITTTTLHSTSLLEYWVLHGSTFLRRSIVSLLRTISRQNVEKFRYIGIELCIALAHSPDPQVSLNALALLEETCHLDPMCLELVLKRAPDLTHFGQFVSNLYYSFLTKPEGVQLLIQNGWLIEQLQVWKKRGYIEYVENSEYALSLALSAHLEISAEDDKDSIAESDKAKTTASKTTASSSSTNPNGNNSTPNTVTQVSANNPQQSPFLGQTPSLAPLLNPKSSIWSQYTLHQPQLWSTRIPIRQPHDDYLRQRLFQLPWNIEIVVETAQRRMVQLIADTFVMEGFADAGTPVINDIMNANPYLANYYGLSALVAKDSAASHQEYEKNLKDNIHASKQNETQTPQALSKQAMQQLGLLQNPPKQLLAPNDLEGSSCMWICAVCLDTEGQPSPVEIDQYSILHSRVSPFLLNTDLMPIGSSSARQQALDNANPFANLISQDITKNITSHYIDVTTINSYNSTTAASTTSSFAGLSTNASSQNSPFHEIRKCYPFEREFHLLPSSYNIDNPTYIYNDDNTQANNVNWHSITTFEERDRQGNALGPTSTLPATLQPERLSRHVHDLDGVSPYFSQPIGLNVVSEDLSFDTTPVLTIPSSPHCTVSSSIISFDSITVGKRSVDDPLPSTPNLHDPRALQAFFEDNDEDDDELAPPPAPEEPYPGDSPPITLPQSEIALAPRLPQYGYCSFYFLDGDVRWNFYRDPARPSKLYLTSVWYKISPSHDILPSVSVVPHLYGELSKTMAGCGLLFNSNIFSDLSNSVLGYNALNPQNALIVPPKPKQTQTTESQGQQLPTNSAAISPALRLRAAMWALAQIGTNEYGARMLIRHGLFSYFTTLAMKSPILSLRGTCFYLIGLLGISRIGREHLNLLGWDCTEEDAQIASVGIALPRDMLSFLHVQSTPLTPGYPLQPMLSATKVNPVAYGPSRGPKALLESPLTPAQLDNQVIITTDPKTGTKKIDIQYDIYSTHTIGVESVPISNLDPHSDRFKALESEHQRILSYCEYELYGTPTIAAVELILGHISNLCNHVSQRSSLQTLRQWKQQYQLLFNSPILFAKVTQLLQMHTFGLPARRFIIFDLFGRVFAGNGKADVAPYMDILIDSVQPEVLISQEVQQTQQLAFQQAQQAQAQAQAHAQQQAREGGQHVHQR